MSLFKNKDKTELITYLQDKFFSDLKARKDDIDSNKVLILIFVESGWYFYSFKHNELKSLSELQLNWWDEKSKHPHLMTVKHALSPRKFDGNEAEFSKNLGYLLNLIFTFYDQVDYLYIYSEMLNGYKNIVKNAWDLALKIGSISLKEKELLFAEFDWQI